MPTYGLQRNRDQFEKLMDNLLGWIWDLLKLKYACDPALRCISKAHNLKFTVIFYTGLLGMQQPSV